MTSLKDRLEEFWKLEKESLPGPWHVGHISENHLDVFDIDSSVSHCVVEDVSGNNGRFILASRNIAPEIIRKLQKQVSVMREALEDIKTPRGCNEHNTQGDPCDRYIAFKALAEVNRIDNE